MIKISLTEEFDTKAVPWDYGTGEIDAVMRSGRCYAPREGKPKKKAVSKEV